MNKKRYTKSPLPFQGQKRNWVKHLENLARKLPEGALVVDVFGGSGLCAHTFKATRPDLRVVWNDYDNFQHRLERIPQTNAYALEVYEVTRKYPKGAHIAPGEEDHKRLCDIFQRATTDGADVQTLSQMVTFSSQCSNVFNPKQKAYTQIRSIQYDATGYLDGVERVSTSFEDLISSMPQEAILILDPPYLSTDTGRYGDKQQGIFWGGTAHLRLLTMLQGRSYIYFTSDKSEVLELEKAVQDAFQTSFLGDHHTLERNAQLSGKGDGYKEYLITNIYLDAQQ